MNATEIIELAFKGNIIPSLCSGYFDRSWPEKQDLKTNEDDEDNEFSDKITLTEEELESFGEVENVESFGGEGQGDHVYMVFYFKDHDVYLRADGYYNSWEGKDWSGSSWYPVRPKQVTKTVYE